MKSRISSAIDKKTEKTEREKTKYKRATLK